MCVCFACTYCILRWKKGNLLNCIRIFWMPSSVTLPIHYKPCTMRGELNVFFFYFWKAMSPWFEIFTKFLSNIFFHNMYVLWKIIAIEHSLLNGKHFYDKMACPHNWTRGSVCSTGTVMYNLLSVMKLIFYMLHKTVLSVWCICLIRCQSSLSSCLYCEYTGCKSWCLDREQLLWN